MRRNQTNLWKFLQILPKTILLPKFCLDFKVNWKFPHFSKSHRTSVSFCSSLKRFWWLQAISVEPRTTHTSRPSMCFTRTPLRSKSSISTASVATPWWNASIGQREGVRRPTMRSMLITVSADRRTKPIPPRANSRLRSNSAQIQLISFMCLTLISSRFTM